MTRVFFREMRRHSSSSLYSLLHSAVLREYDLDVLMSLVHCIQYRFNFAVVYCILYRFSFNYEVS